MTINCTIMFLYTVIPLTLVLLICAPLNNEFVTERLIIVVFGLIRSFEMPVNSMPDRTVAQESNYIVGGVDAKPGELPYQVSLQRNNAHMCGGSIINHCWILTAAHCVLGVKQSTLSILAGTTKLIHRTGVESEIAKVITHEKYNPNKTYINDIALLKLKKCLTYGKNIYRVKLSMQYVGEDVRALVSGWGFTDTQGTQRTKDLKKLEVKTASNQYCRTHFRQDIPDQDLCSSPVNLQGFCQGDSGGPLVEIESEILIGVVSANIPCAKAFPDIYTRVSSYYEWIKDHIK